MRSLLIVTLLVFAAVGWLAFESLAPRSAWPAPAASALSLVDRGGA